jgi:protein associated with RNAse G/E
LNYDDVEEVLENRKEEHFVSDIDRHIVKDVTDLLSVFKIGSEKLSADDVPTLHSVLPWFHKFKKSCE